MLAAIAVAALPPTGAAAAEPAPQESPARAEAARRFAEGLSAFDRGDYRAAALAFEAAARLAPHVDTVWNAARAWARAGDTARAATLYARYLRDSAPDAAGRTLAQQQLAALATRLGRVEVHADRLAQLTIDGTPSDETIVYVAPGSHIVDAMVGTERRTQTVNVGAGESTSVAFTAPREDAPPRPPVPASPPAVVPATASGTGAAPERATAHGGWSPWVVAGGGVLTAGAVGVTVWSGLQTLDTLNAFDAHPTPSNLARGQSEQTRTNVLLSVTVGLGVLTGLAAVWFVDWHGRDTRDVHLALGPTGASARWDF